ncbi:UNVERIFIED_ORG: hypothetical protein EDC92_1161 [Dietzia maris]|uniref:hypothetical protein n=1 Tax=Dietzia maris TaxID=37915 RepID=UPI001044F75D
MSENIIGVEGGTPMHFISEGGTLSWHHQSAETEETTAWCGEVVDVDTSAVTAWEPISLKGTLSCPRCGLAGGVLEGTFIRVFRQEPGQTRAEALAAYHRYRLGPRRIWSPSDPLSPGATRWSVSARGREGRVHIQDPPEDMEPGQAEEFANALLAAAEQLRAWKAGVDR